MDARVATATVRPATLVRARHTSEDAPRPNAATSALLGQKVRLSALPTQAGQPGLGTHGRITGVGAATIPNPIRVTFEDAARTVRHYSRTQFDWLFTALN